jgi:LysM repeat protein
MTAMNDTAAIVDRPLATRSAPVPRATGHAGAADFGALLADAQAAAGSVEDRPADAGRSTHLVRAGETLYGIAKARLAQAGQPATPAASMRHALEIAQINRIRDPDRIYAGQVLQVSASAASIAVPKPTTLEAGRSMAPSADAGIYALHDPRPHWATAADVPDEPSAHVHAAEYAIDSAPAEPIVFAAQAADDITPEDAAPSLAGSVEKARASLALYQQSAAAAAPAPPTDVPDLVYKGVVGKALDLVPLDPSTRTGLQQANAIIGGSLAGRSLAALTGLGGPLLTVAGLLWGIFSAAKLGSGQSGAPNQVAQSTRTSPLD